MEEEKFFKIEGIELENFRSVKKGNVYFNEYTKLKNKEYDEDSFSSILGIYGPNGSGKTSIIEGLKIIKKFIEGKIIKEDLKEYVKKGEEAFKISTYYLLKSNNTYLINYVVEINKSGELVEEMLNLQKIAFNNEEGYEFLRKETIFKYNKDQGGSGFLFNDLTNVNKHIFDYLIENLRNSNNVSSILFNANFNKILFNLEEDKEGEKKEEILKIIKDLQGFFKNNVVLLTENIFEKEDETLNSLINLSLLKKGSKSIEENDIPTLENKINTYNNILSSLLNSYSLSLEVLGKRLDENNNVLCDIELTRIKDGHKIPIYYESSGIKKIILILEYLISTFNNTDYFLAIDEFDSGIFEYLLGEIVYVFENFAKGQLLFTSHNFRTLEKLSYKNIFFTTMNDEELFIKVKGVRDSSNLRKLYYRYLKNGYEKDIKFYNDTSLSDIATSFLLDEGEK